MKVFRVFAVFAFSAASAWGTYSIISSFHCPGQEMYAPKGIDWHGGYIYHVKNSDFTFYKTTETGSLAATFRCYPYTTRPRDIAATDTNLWIINEPAPLNVYRFTTTGSFLGSFPVRQSGTGYGITAAGPYVYVSLRDTWYWFNTYTTTGSLVATFRSSSLQHRSGPLDYDGMYLYTGEVSSIRKWMINVYTGYIYTSGWYYDGIACQGPYFWFASYTRHHVYKIGAVTTDIAPTSIGRVKALFR